ncbi:hypothetical protein ACIGD1_01485 [Streptomyces sp. NPDC085612]|uniref:hypothetical protein n=1 Tax=Streptomyces sp. NPDC085612 TaxID=3365732 RepID=UPI0037CD1B32
MSEQQDALEDLEEAGVLAAMSWAAESAYARTMRDYDPDAGHDQGWVGYTAHGFLRDRQDRVFSCGKYAVSSPADALSGLDTVAAGLLPGEFKRMPRILPGAVRRANLNGSPGWRFRDWRWLQAAFPFGESNAIPWSQKSPTKRRVAAQHLPGPADQPMLPVDEDEAHLFEDVMAATLLALDESADGLTTLVLAHAVQKELGVRELFVGRSRLNKGGGAAWHWKHDLLKPPFGDYGRGAQPVAPKPSGGFDAVPDAAVRLRRHVLEGDGK